MGAAAGAPVNKRPGPAAKPAAEPGPAEPAAEPSKALRRCHSAMPFLLPAAHFKKLHTLPPCGHFKNLIEKNKLITFRECEALVGTPQGNLGTVHAETAAAGFLQSCVQKRRTRDNARVRWPTTSVRSSHETSPLILSAGNIPN